ncbi:uncharacterized protein LOC143218374 isoform X1 [Lasioglossum baleicum]|uniref:uncharacterized protein LOC143218374 isoform X1 n=1 Tax=Lasioglossum baleicum TaxID=434251 RepID=UPI003FCEC3B1
MNAPVSDLKVKMWSPAVPLKTPDNIVSSQFTLQKVFVPSYEKEKRPCMEQLLTNEYQRIWWQEKETWDRRFNATPTTKKLLQRKVVIRKKSSKEPVKEIPKKIIKSRRKVEPKKTAEKTKTAEETKKPEKVKKSEGTQKSEEGAQKSEGTKKSKATEVIPTETTDDKQEDK